MCDTLASTPTVNDTCDILTVTITANISKGEIRTDITHTPELTLDERREPVTVAARSFPRRVACPVSAARELADATRARHPRAIVTLVNA